MAAEQHEHKIPPKLLSRVYHLMPNKVQRILLMMYHDLIFLPTNLRALYHFIVWDKTKKIDDLNKYEMSVYSQNGEDGIIKAIFKQIGNYNKFAVEFGCWSNEANTILLKRNGWTCLQMDGNGDGTHIKKEFITRENINILLDKYNVPRDMDLLSVDIDGNDYWVLKEILTYYRPRCIVVEYNSTIDVSESKAIIYNAKQTYNYGDNYFSASLLAFQRLCAKSGYTLIATDKRGVNAFFVPYHLAANYFVIKDIKDIIRYRGAFDKSNKDWVKV